MLCYCIDIFDPLRHQLLVYISGISPLAQVFLLPLVYPSPGLFNLYVDFYSCSLLCAFFLIN